MQSKSVDVGGFMPEAETLLARAEKFRTTTLEAGAFGWEFEDRGPNPAALREAARLGMTGIEVDRRFGGLGFGFREKVRVAEILSRSSIGFAFSLLNSQNVAARISTLGRDRHRDVYLADLLAGRRFGATALTEPGAGSDFAAITTTAAPTNDGWVLNGSKAWITNGAMADVILCYVQTDPDQGRDGIACFVIDGRRDGFRADDPYQLVAGSTIGVAGFTLDGYEAAEDDMIVEPGAAFRQALSGVTGARIYVAAMACAAVRTALGHAVDYGTDRETFGRRLLDHQGVAWSLADVANRLEAAEALTARAVDRYMAGEEPDSDDDADGPRRTALAAAHAKKFSVEMLEPALQQCMQAMGAEGLRADHVAGRLLSESRVLGYVDGTTEMQTERISRSLGRFYRVATISTASVAARRPSEPAGQPPLAEPMRDTGSSTVDREPAQSDDPVERGDANSDRADAFFPGRGGGALAASAAVAASAEPESDRVSVEDSITVDTVRDRATRTVEYEPGMAAGLDGPVTPGTPEPDGPAAHEPSPVALPAQPPMPPSAFTAEPGVDGSALDEPAQPLDDERWSPPDPTTAASADIPPPPPPTGAPIALDPPPPPPTGPPLAADPPLPPDSEMVDLAVGATPPAPPDIYQTATSTTDRPPMPGDEHRLDDDGDDGETATPDVAHTSPPLPPDSMRR